MAPRQRFAEVSLSGVVQFEPNTTEAVIQEILTENSIDRAVVSIQETTNSKELKFNTPPALEGYRIRIPDHLYVWVKF